MTGLIDLAARRLGGMVLAASDEYFAAKENLLEPSPPRFDPERYTDRGKEMDGWETRRRRDHGHDWALVRLGVPGVVHTIVVDTTHFRGNAPQACAIEGCVAEAGPPDDDTTWFPLRDRTELRPDAAQPLAVTTPWRVTHVRLSIYPDGGVARLRALGVPLVDLHRAVGAGDRLDLATAVNGGRAVACSDAFFSSPHHLVDVGDARDMADGWETRRRRGPGFDWAVIELATIGIIERVEIDTTHFKGNHPDRCALDALHRPGLDPAAIADLPDDAWTALVEPLPMQPHARQAVAVTGAAPASHVRLRALPDGGVARLRVYGAVTEEGWRRAGLALLNALPPADAEAALRECCGSTAWARTMADRRPFADAAALLDTADEVWRDRSEADWYEAFAAHPRIGERADGWSAGEQAGTHDADSETMTALADGNRAYEERFGHVFLIRAAGRSADEMLAALRARLDHDPATELKVAAEEQRQITRLRLDKLLREGREGG